MSGYNKGTCTPMFIAALLAIAKLYKQPTCPNTDEWIKKMWYLYTIEFYSAIRKMKFCQCRQVNGTGKHQLKGS
jgi:hypothetical protein